MKLAAKEIAELARPILGSPAKELSELIADRVRFWRWRSAVKIMRRARAFQEAGKIQASEVPLKFFLPFLEEGSKEDPANDEICDLWARLLATASTETTGFDMVCIDVLKSIGPTEAQFLKRAEKSAEKMNGWPSLLQERLLNELRHENYIRMSQSELITAVRDFVENHEAVLVLEWREDDSAFPEKEPFLETSLMKKEPFTFVALLKAGLIEVESLNIGDGALYQTVMSGVLHPDIGTGQPGARTAVANVVTLTRFGALFMKRCGG